LVVLSLIVDTRVVRKGQIWWGWHAQLEWGFSRSNPKASRALCRHAVVKSILAP
jgi:hypothetical protein